MKTQKITRPISSHLNRTSFDNRGFIIWPKKNFLIALRAVTIQIERTGDESPTKPQLMAVADLRTRQAYWFFLLTVLKSLNVLEKRSSKKCKYVNFRNLYR